MFNEFRVKYHLKKLHKKLKQQNLDRHPRDFEDAVTVGILFDASKSENFQIVMDYAEVLKKRGKRVDILAYIDDKARHNDFAFKHFNRRDLDFFLTPKSNLVVQFMNTPFDVLMAFYTDPILPLEYVSSMSKAQMRVGFYHPEKTHCYDLMIDTLQNTNLRQYIKEADNMLRIINKKQKAHV